MTTAVATGFAVLALVCFAAPSLSRWIDRRRLAVPEFTALCMAIQANRQVRMELRIRRPASAQDWSVRKIEWLEPVGVRIAARPSDVDAQCELETNLFPRGGDGCWFASDASLWAFYPRQGQPAHRVRLRITVERTGERARTLLLTCAFPAMDWASAAPARPTPSAESPAPLHEPRSWQSSDWSGPGTAGLA